MANLYRLIAGFYALSVQSVAEAQEYYRKVQGEYYSGLPGVAITAACFAVLSSELEDFPRNALGDYADLWLLDMPNGGTFVTTSLHQARPGVALSEFLQKRQLTSDLDRFLLQWREMVGVFYALKCLYVLTDPDEPVLVQAAHTKGLN